jgi:hypothetical protein
MKSRTKLPIGYTELLIGYDIGHYFAAISRCFGARAPVEHIASQLCIEAERYDSELVRDGIETSIIDWWLEDWGLVSDWDIRNEQAAYILSEIYEPIEVLNYDVCWLVVDAFNRGELVSEEVWEKITYERQLLMDKLESANEAIEKEAIKIGL